MMSLRSFYYLSTLLLCFHPVFRPHALVASDTPGTLQFYNDYDCEHPSTLNPTVTLQLSTCLVFTGAEGVVIDTVPPCPQGTAAPIYYSDTACGVQTNNVSPSIFSKGCFSLADGVDIFNAKSMIFSCQPAANNPHPSSTTTAVVSALAAVATGSTGSNGGGSGSGSGSASGSGSSTSSASGSSSTGTETQKNSTSGTGSSSQISPGTSSSSRSGLTTGDIIALAVGLGIGLPTIVIMILAWRFPSLRDRMRDLTPGLAPHQPDFPHSQSHQRLHGEPTELAVQPNKTQQRHYNHLYELPSQRTGPQQSPYNRPQEMDAQQQRFGAY